MKKSRFDVYSAWIMIALAGFLVLACNLPGYFIQSVSKPAASQEAAVTVRVEPIATPTPPVVVVEATRPAEDCLVGTWEVSSIHEYVLAAIPPEMAEQYNLQYQGTNGSAYFILSPDGQVRMQADELELLFEASAAIFTVPVTARVDGEAVGRYTTDGSALTTSDMDTSGLSASAQAMGQELLTPAQIFRTIPLLQPPANSAQYTCTDDTLQLKVSAYPESIPPLVFSRK